MPAPTRTIPEKRSTLRLQVGASAIARLAALDDQLCGTPAYLGIAWFWSRTFRHYLRDAPLSRRVRVHDAFLRNGLKLAGDTLRHWEIVHWICARTPKRRTRELYAREMQCSREQAAARIAALRADPQIRHLPGLGVVCAVGFIPCAEHDANAVIAALRQQCAPAGNPDPATRRKATHQQ